MEAFCIALHTSGWGFGNLYIEDKNDLVGFPSMYWLRMHGAAQEHGLPSSACAGVVYGASDGHIIPGL